MMFIIFTIKPEFLPAFKMSPFYKGHEKAIYSEKQSDGTIYFEHRNKNIDYIFETKIPVLWVDIIDKVTLKT